MECSEPGAIRDEELFAYLGGEKVRPAVVQHLAMCAYCSSRLATYQRMDQTLLKNLYRWDCPSNQMLGEYQLGMLSGREAAAISRHLNICPLCAAEVTALAQFLANDPMLVEPVPLPQVRVAVRPAANNHHVVHNVRNALDQLREQSREGVRRILAVLEPPQPRLAWERTQTPTPQALEWPRRYTAEDMQISLQVEQGANRKDALQLIGFVMRKGTTLDALQGTPVQLFSSAQAISMQNIDELGNFIFPAVTPATYRLEIQLSEGIVVIDQLTLMALD
jgi:hypothetical protein